jgi:hypothetical protein
MFKDLSGHSFNPELAINAKNIPLLRDRVSLIGKMGRVLVRSFPEMIKMEILKARKKKDLADQRYEQWADGVTVEMTKYIISNEIGTEEFRMSANDELQRYKKAKGLPKSTLLDNM